LEPAIIAEGDLRAEQRFEGGGRLQGAAVDAAQNVIERFERRAS
jgi:hypothetical protein